MSAWCNVGLMAAEPWERWHCVKVMNASGCISATEGTICTPVIGRHGPVSYQAA